ncbi:MAG TPA: hypothetical protein VIT45_01500 [Allosphingosinicella sp.]
MPLPAFLLALLALLALTACAPAAAPGPAPLSYDCQTPTGRLSELDQVQPGPSYRISGTIRADELRADSRWESAGNIFVESADEQDRVMLQLVSPDRGERLRIVLRTHHGEKQEARPLGAIAVGEEVPFVLAVDGGRAKAEIGALEAEAAVDPGTSARVGVGCAGGSFRFGELRFGMASK